MKTRMKKLSSLFLSFALVMSLVAPTNVFAEEVSTEVVTETETESQVTVETEVAETVVAETEIVEAEASEADDFYAKLIADKTGGVRGEGYEAVMDDCEGIASYSDFAEQFEIVETKDGILDGAKNWTVYNTLSAQEKAWWDAMDAVCNSYLNSTANVATRMNVRYSDGTTRTIYTLPYANVGSTSSSTQEKMVTLFRYANPQYYFLDSSWIFSGTNLTIQVFDLFADGNQRMNYTNALQGKVNWYLAQVDNSKMPEEREKQIHDLVCNTITYTFGDYDQSVFSSLYQDATVCAGYTMIMTMLLNMNGIQTLGVAGFGDTYANQNARHAWNMVNLYGNWYYVDATWDDGDPGVYYKYYNISKSTLYKDHYLQPYYSSIVPSASYNSGNYTWAYSTPYFNSGNFKYFIINRSSSVESGSGTRYVRIVDVLNNSLSTDVPATVSYDGYTYYVQARQIPAFAQGMYTKALNRAADPAGFRYFTYALSNGLETGCSAAMTFLCGAEIYQSGISQYDFAARAYRTLLSREPDAGIDYWVNLLNNGVSREYVVKGFGASPEFANLCNNAGITIGGIWLPEARDQNANVTMYVFRCYARTLGRAPDVAGLNNWTELINTRRMSPANVAEFFVFSDEFTAKNYNNVQYVQVLYSMFFDRAADDAGLAYWVGELNSGRKSRKDVFNGFVYTNEFNAILASFGF